MKSLATCVFFPAWCWLHGPHLQFLFSSYAESLSIRDSVKCRRLMMSPRYQRLINKYQPDFKFVGDQNTKTRFENNFGGYRLATSVGGALTGEGGDIIVIDDAHNVMNVESDIQRTFVIDWWKEAMSTRLNDPKTGAYVLIMQRTHEEDLCGYVLKQDEESQEWCWLCIPARYEVGDNRGRSPLTFTDPRTEENEPLWPERFDEQQLQRLEKNLDEYGSACQLQQRPVPRKGGEFKVDNFRIVDSFSKGLIVETIRYWDKAGTEGGGMYSAGVRMHKMREDCPYRVLITDVQRGQWSSHKREQMIKATTERDTELYGEGYSVWVEQEPGSGGKESAENTVRNLAGFNIHVDPVGQGDGNKVARARPFAAQVEAGQVAILNSPWRKAYVNELRFFPKSKFKDQVDSSSGGFNKLFVKKGRAGGW